METNDPNMPNMDQFTENPQKPGGKEPSAEYQQIAGLLSDVDRRLRILEERYSNLRKKLQLTDQNLLESERAFGKEMKGFTDQMMELKHVMNDLNDKVVIFNNELDTMADKTDLKVLEKYLTMWSPENFVTRKELKNFLIDKGLLEREEE